MGTQLKHFAPEAVKMLQDRNWPGNIRELRNVVERLIILGSQTISKEDVEMFA
jgi:DNA-binding NtrC family response regulator